MTRITLDIISGPDYSRDDNGWEHNAYTVELQNGHRRMRAPWMQGLGITDDPTAEAVLESIIQDAQSFWHAGRASYTPEAFADWCDEYGYDSDSRKIYALYEQIGALTDDLTGLLGAEEFHAAMDDDAAEVAASLAAVSAEVDS